jgi:hypothetical protein
MGQSAQKMRRRKPQVPRSKFQGNSKIQIAEGFFKFWALEFLWSLVLGIWSFAVLTEDEKAFVIAATDAIFRAS